MAVSCEFDLDLNAACRLVRTRDGLADRFRMGARRFSPVSLSAVDELFRVTGALPRATLSDLPAHLHDKPPR